MNRFPTSLSLLLPALYACCLLPCAGLNAIAQGGGSPAFTEDFESGAINKNVWTELVQGDATIKVASGDAAHGKYALVAHYPQGTNRSLAFIVTSHLPDELRLHYFGRAYVKITPKLPMRHTVLLLSGTSGYPMSNFLEIGDYNGTLQTSYQLNAEPRPKRGEAVHHGPVLPTGKWICLEWEFNDNPDQINVWIDGQKVDEAEFTFRDAGNRHLVNGFTDAAFGTRVWGDAPEAFDVSYDDIALGTSRIGTIQ
ncbi:MAG TPA: hypothetical protein VG675_06165 [Bryobacteraceae bacterium]|nr:hypothetical protein [Bryobacteraceae bacterium]